MAYVPNSGSVIAFQGTVPWSVLGTVTSTGSVISIQQGSVAAVIIGGSIAASFTPPANQSVSGTVQTDVRGSIAAVIIGGSIAASFTPPANQSVSGSVGIVGNPSISGTVLVNNGSVVAFQGGAPWAETIVGSVLTVSQSSIAVNIIAGSITASFTPPVNQSVSGTVGASIIGLTPVAFAGASAAGADNALQAQVFNTTGGNSTLNFGAAGYVFNGTNWDRFRGNSSVGAIVNTGTSSVVVVVIGSVATVGTAVANQSVSGTVGASIIGLPPVNVTNTNLNVAGSVIAFPVGNQSVSGTVNVGSVLVFPGIVSAANSTTTPVTSTLSFTGTGEEWKDFGTISINVFTDASSATDGLSIQQSSDNANWDIRDTYTISSMAAGGGKEYQVQPGARFGRVVYTQGPQNSGAFRLQTVYHPQRVKPSSQRPGDGYTNETDLEQMQGFNMVYNGATWDRMRGTTGGALVTGSVQQGTSPWVVNFQNSSILAVPVGSVITVNQSSSILAVPVGSVQTIWQSPSIVGTYVEDAASASGDKGVFSLNARNDTLSSVSSSDGDYTQFTVGPAGEGIVANSPITKWVQGTNSILGGVPLTSSVIVIAAQGASIFTYITGVQVANMSSTGVLVSLYGATDSIIGRTVAPANGGSNIVFPNPLKTSANGAFSASVSGTASVYVAAQGFISKT